MARSPHSFYGSLGCACIMTGSFVAVRETSMRHGSGASTVCVGAWGKAETGSGTDVGTDRAFFLLKWTTSKASICRFFAAKT